jgi:hypothetical protein
MTAIPGSGSTTGRKQDQQQEKTGNSQREYRPGASDIIGDDPESGDGEAAEEGKPVHGDLQCAGLLPVEPLILISYYKAPCRLLTCKK